MCNLYNESYTVVYENSLGAFVFQMPESEKAEKNKAMAERLIKASKEKEMKLDNQSGGEVV